MVHNADCRSKNLDPDSTSGKGYITESLVAKFLGVKTCFDITGNFNHGAFDMYEDEDWGIINVKGSSLHHYREYSAWCFHIDKNVVPDFFFCIGYDEYMKSVESVHIIPNGYYACKLVCVHIPKDRRSKWDVFKESEEEIRKWNELFHMLRLDNCPVLRKIGSRKALEKKKIRLYKERMRKEYKRYVINMSNNGYKTDVRTDNLDTLY